jgi:gas vesicle protein
MSRRRTARASAWGFLVGGAAGFSLGLLLAPDEGRQLRRRVAYLLDRWAADLSGVLDRLETPSSESSAARAKANALVADAREQAARLLDEADALIADARSRRPTADRSASDRPADTGAAAPPA